MTADLPPPFDPTFYRSVNADLHGMTESQLIAHFREFGLAEGRAGSAPARREAFLPLIPRDKLVLEIGPWFKPAITGPHARYFDVFPREELMKRASELGGDPSGCPEIHYVSETGDLGSIPDRFGAVFSSHAIEHQPDLVRHLQVVGDLLSDDGYYFVIAPDKRYCFDYFIAESTLADVLDAHLRRLTLHEPRRILEYRLLRTHNEPMRHWEGDHGVPMIEEEPEQLQSAIAEASNYNLGYIDTHAWRFTPSSFGYLTETVFNLGLTKLRPCRVYNSVRGTSEFTAILQKS